MSTANAQAVPSDHNDIASAEAPRSTEEKGIVGTEEAIAREVEALQPFNWPLRRKWAVTSIACYATFIVGINSTSITAAATIINADFAISDVTIPNSYWSVTSWNTGAAIAPMIILPLMETYGMRPGYLISYITFFVFVIPQAVAPNFATMIICRFFAGCCGGVIQDVMDGIIADIWSGPVERSLPVTLYVVSLLAGVSFGPVFGGAVVSSLGWRWVFYIQLIIYGTSFPLIWRYFRETRVEVVLQRSSHAKAIKEKASDGKQSLGKFLYDAVVLPTYLLCTEPVVFFFTLLSALSYGLVFLGTQSVSQVYTALYGWEEYQTGLVQIALVIGELIGAVACLAQNRTFAKRLAKSGAAVQSLDSSVAESRLYLCIIGSFFGLTGGLLWYGWTSYGDLHWILPTIGLAIVGFGVMTVMQAIMMYVTDAYEKHAASASAAVCFGENMFAAFLPLSALSMYTNLGFHWASSLLALIALIMSIAPVLLVAKGRSVRRRSPFIKEAAFHADNG